MSTPVVGPDTRITLHFSIELESGEMLDSTRDKAPATFEFGDGNLLPGFEQALQGLKAGQKSRLRIAPEQGFGMPNPSNVQQFGVDEFSEIELEPGLVIDFQDPSGSLPGVVQSIENEQVWIDFNHPLAGRMLYFDVEILAVELI